MKTRRKNRQPGMNAKAWFYSQSFQSSVIDVQTLAEYRAQVARENHAAEIALALCFMAQEAVGAA